MILYHGTSAEVARKALIGGLKPRGRKKSTWRVSSGSDRVYLTNAYPLYFAANASEDLWGVVEVDTSLLSPLRMVPDEDFLEQATRGKPSECPAGAVSIEARTKWFKDNAKGYRHTWELSMGHLGTAAHIGPVPPHAITRIALYDPKSNGDMTLKALDPVISLMNYMVCGDKYKALTRWLFEGDVPVEELFDTQYFDMMPGQNAEKVMAQVVRATANRAGIEIIKNVNYFSKAS